ncbi:MAG: dockerin type I repeat-containing protein [Clostridia bacterium]|nr:dockerin type I repeat-containing protein [Clostridia bacterium]
MICGKNRALCGFLAASLFITLASGICADEAARQQRSIPGYVLGDLDGDSEVSWDDDKLFKEYFAGIETEMQYICADINEDGFVTRRDAMILARYLAGWDGYSLGAESAKLPWEVPGAKQPADYTFAEFNALTSDQQMAFQNSFGSIEAFIAWLEKAQEEADKLPWEEPGAKQPCDYTYAEFLALTGDQQMAFQNSFGSIEAFEAWLEKAQADKLPWDEPGAKQPCDYTYAEYMALTGDQQMAFQNSFGSIEAFEEWLEKAQADKLPWDEPGAKQPEEYTWEEFLNLTPDQQIAFQNSFEEADGFAKWAEKNQPEE